MWISREKIRKHRRRWLFFGVWLPMAILAMLWFGVSPDVPDYTIRSQRNASGDFVDQLLGEDPPAAGAKFEAQFGSLNAQNNLTSASNVNSSDPSYLALGHIAILNRSDHLLMKRVGGLVLEQLKQQPQLQKIDYYPRGKPMLCRERAPDVFVTLDLGNLDESGLLIKHKLNADVEVTASDNLVRSNHSYVDNRTPPRITFRWDSKLQHESTTTGVRSSAAKYKLAAEDIAKQITAALVKQFDQWREKYGPLPELPDEFYPAYQAAPTPSAIQKREAELLFTGHGLMNRNQTVWEFQSDGNPRDVLRTIGAELAADGWTVPEFRPEEDVQHLRVKLNGGVLEVFPKRQAGYDIAKSRQAQGREESEPLTFYATFLDRMSHDEIQAACKQLLEREPPVEALVMFRGHWYSDRDLQRKILKYLQSKSVSSPEALIAISELLHRDNRDDEARQALLAAYVLSHTLPSPNKYQGRLEGLAKDWEMEDLASQTIDAELLRNCGMRELLPDTRIAKIELGLNEPAVFFRTASDGTTHLHSYRVVVGKNNPYELSFVASGLGTGSREWGQGGSVSEDQWYSQQRSLNESDRAVRFFVRKLPHEPRFVAAADVVDANRPSATVPYEE